MKEQKRDREQEQQLLDLLWEKHGDFMEDISFKNPGVFAKAYSKMFPDSTILRISDENDRLVGYAVKTGNDVYVTPDNAYRTEEEFLSEYKKNAEGLQVKVQKDGILPYSKKFDPENRDFEVLIERMRGAIDELSEKEKAEFIPPLLESEQKDSGPVGNIEKIR